MLAMSDRDGVVEASVPGLADAARVSLSDCADALERLKQPDEYSRSSDFDGRRIADVDGGWEILNYSKYREMASLDERRRKAAIRQAKYRERKKDALCKVTTSNAPQSRVMKNNDNAEAEAEADPEAKKKNPPKPPGGLDARFEKFWKAFDNPKSKAYAEKCFRKAVKAGLPDSDTLVAIIQKQKAQRAKLKASGEFVPPWPNPSTWLNQGRWTDEYREVKKKWDPGPDGIPF
jgi:hypothetical protein